MILRKILVKPVGETIVAEAPSREVPALPATQRTLSAVSEAFEQVAIYYAYTAMGSGLFHLLFYPVKLSLFPLQMMLITWVHCGAGFAVASAAQRFQIEDPTLS